MVRLFYSSTLLENPVQMIVKVKQKSVYTFCVCVETADRRGATSQYLISKRLEVQRKGNIVLHLR